MRRLAGLLALAACAAAQQTGPANEHYQTPEQRERMAAGLGSASRDRTQKPAALIASLRIRQGWTVADIGTGSGYMLPYLSRAVGPAGRVLAEDVFPEMIERAAQSVKTERLRNVTCILGTAADPKLPAGAVDLALMLDVYHHIDDPPGMLARVREALKSTGIFVIVDYYRKPGAIPGCDAEHHIRADRDAVIAEIESNGFRLLETRDHISGSQYLAVFRKGSAL